MAPCAGGAGAALLIGGLPGSVVGLLLGVALHQGMARMPLAEAQPTRVDRRLVDQLPLTAELLAACMAASGPPSDAADAVARAVGSPMRERLAGVAAELRMGADPADCWERLADGCPALAPLGRCLARASTSGAPPSATLARLAEEQRAAAARAATARTGKAGVLATAPLGGCFLPAFVLIGIVPVVTGLASAFLGRR
ncbi:type II secretion system F family protein [Peterkaempfera sp. SMS 1(5)a]|uniref:type II secretion system F family protein n=1 Tax=Peterkaempfera podocarpi TaxID=3232308 RepID=UPI00366CA22C